MYDPQKHNRRSIRLKGYDYAQEGLYYITICTQNKERLFGEIVETEMHLNSAGKMIEKWLAEINNKWEHVSITDKIIMPNHIHIIIWIDIPVGADLCVCPVTVPQGQISVPQGQTHRSAPTIGTIIQWLKTMTTNEYIRNVKTNNWETFDTRLWQRNYYEHIIRNNQSYLEISRYIEENPMNWVNDNLYE